MSLVLELETCGSWQLCPDSSAECLVRQLVDAQSGYDLNPWTFALFGTVAFDIRNYHNFARLFRRLGREG